MKDPKIQGQQDLLEKVLEKGLCTVCGACVNLCSYMVSLKDRIVVMDSCDRAEGRCYDFCPRTFTDWLDLQRRLFPSEEIILEPGVVKGFFMTRTADPGIRRSAQHGGTVTALVSLALQQGIIAAAVFAKKEEKFLPRSVTFTSPQEINKGARSKFVVSATVDGFNEGAKQNLARSNGHPLSGHGSGQDEA